MQTWLHKNKAATTANTVLRLEIKKLASTHDRSGPHNTLADHYRTTIIEDPTVNLPSRCAAMKDLILLKQLEPSHGAPIPVISFLIGKTIPQRPSTSSFNRNRSVSAERWKHQTRESSFRIRIPNLNLDRIRGTSPCLTPLIGSLVGSRDSF